MLIGTIVKITVGPGETRNGVIIAAFWDDESVVYLVRYYINREAHYAARLTGQMEVLP